MQADRLIKTQYTSTCIFSTDRSKWLNLAFTILCLEHCKERNPLHLFTFLYSLLFFSLISFFLESKLLLGFGLPFLLNSLLCSAYIFPTLEVT